MHVWDWRAAGEGFPPTSEASHHFYHTGYRAKETRVEPIITVLTAGVVLGLKATATQAVKDAYAAVKKALGGGPSALKEALADAEKRPNNKGLVQGLIEDALTQDASTLKDPTFVAALESLRKAISDESAQRRATGIKLDEIEESIISINSVDVAGTASGVEATRIKKSEVRIGTVKAQGDPSGNG
jgi:hypothetical protein